MNLSRCKNAIIYDKNDLQNPLFEVGVSDIHDNIVTLTVHDDVIDDFDSEMDITFLDETLGLVIYKCLLSAPKRFLSSDGEWFNSIECELVEMLSTIQRREDFKIKIDLNLTAIIPKDIEIPEDFKNYTHQYGNNLVKGKSVNLSAGGIFFTCDFKFYKDLKTDLYITLSSGQAVKVSVQILRIEEYQNKNGTKTYGYGCKYSNISSGLESTIRNFVFKKQRENRTW